MKKLLSELKEGDTVIVNHGGFGSLPEPRKIERTTPATITIDGLKYDRDDGIQIRKKSSQNRFSPRAKILAATPEEIAACEDRLKIRKHAWYLRECSLEFWEKRGLDKLEQIAAIINE